MSSGLEHPPSLADRVQRLIGEKIQRGQMQPGTLFSVYQVADELQISRSPVREGLLKLEEAGLLEFSRNRGFSVVKTEPRDIAEIFAIRLALEVPAASRAAETADDRLCDALDAHRARMADGAERGAIDDFFEADAALHREILSATSSRRVVHLVDRLRSTVRAIGAETVGQRGLVDVLVEHDPVVEAIRARDAEAAGAAMHAHIATTGWLLLQQAAAADGLDDPRRLWEQLVGSVPSDDAAPHAH